MSLSSAFSRWICRIALVFGAVWLGGACLAGACWGQPAEAEAEFGRPLHNGCWDMNPAAGFYMMAEDAVPTAPVAKVCTGQGTACSYPNTAVTDTRSGNTPGQRPCVWHQRYGDLDCAEAFRDAQLDTYTSHNSCG